MTLGSSERLNAAIARLADTIDARANDDPAGSYTASLLEKGVGKCAQKIGEEGVELALALVSQPETASASEAADLLYHVLVGLRSRGIALDQVAGILEQRAHQSGLAEKAARKNST